MNLFVTFQRLRKLNPKHYETKGLSSCCEFGINFIV